MDAPIGQAGLDTGPSRSASGPDAGEVYAHGVAGGAVIPFRPPTPAEVRMSLKVIGLRPRHGTIGMMIGGEVAFDIGLAEAAAIMRDLGRALLIHEVYGPEQ